MYTFEITDTRSEDTGRYVVVAQNSEGTERYSVSLMVKELNAPDSSDFRSVLRAR